MHTYYAFQHIRFMLNVKRYFPLCLSLGFLHLSQKMICLNFMFFHQIHKTHDSLSGCRWLSTKCREFEKYRFFMDKISFFIKNVIDL